MRLPIHCRDCNQCCSGPFRFLVIDPAEALLHNYETQKFHGMTVLAMDEEGTCKYLKDGKCSIHERKPSKCREFDCRDYITNPGMPIRIRKQGLLRI